MWGLQYRRYSCVESRNEGWHREKFKHIVGLVVAHLDLISRVVQLREFVKCCKYILCEGIGRYFGQAKFIVLSKWLLGYVAYTALQ